MLEGMATWRIPEVELTRTTVMLLNNSRPPFDDPLVRQAIQKAVDTQAIVDGIYEGAVRRPSDRSDRTRRGRPRVSSRPARPDEARSLLARPVWTLSR